MTEDLSLTVELLEYIKLSAIAFERKKRSKIEILDTKK